MPSKKHKPEEIIGKLREVEIVLAQDRLALRARIKIGRSAWPTRSIIYSASHGSKTELRLLEIEMVRHDLGRLAEPGKTSPQMQPIRLPPPAQNPDVF